MRRPWPLSIEQEGLPLYREGLRVPVRWWAQWTLLIGSFWLALVVAVPEALAWAVTAVLMCVLIVVLRAYGSARIIVTDDWLHVGRAHVQRQFLGPVEPLDAPTMRSLAGPKANARAFLLLRPYIATGVRIAIDDPEDDTPYWLVSSRQAAVLAAALGNEGSQPLPHQAHEADVAASRHSSDPAQPTQQLRESHADMREPATPAPTPRRAVVENVPPPLVPLD